MSAAIDVLKRKASRSPVNFLMRRFVRRGSSDGSASPPEESACVSESTRLSQRETPSIPLPSHGPPSFHGPINIRKPLSASEPKRSTYSCGLTTLPRLLLIFCPSGPRMVPWLRRRVIGSSKSTSPRSLITFVKKGGERRGSMGWSMPPGDWVTRGHLFPRTGANGAPSLWGGREREQKHQGGQE